jgi:hypothetical protein
MTVTCATGPRFGPVRSFHSPVCGLNIFPLPSCMTGMLPGCCGSCRKLATASAAAWSCAARARSYSARVPSPVRRFARDGSQNSAGCCGGAAAHSSRQRYCLRGRGVTALQLARRQPLFLREAREICTHRHQGANAAARRRNQLRSVRSHSPLFRTRRFPTSATYSQSRPFSLNSGRLSQKSSGSSLESFRGS